MRKLFGWKRKFNVEEVLRGMAEGSRQADEARAEYNACVEKYRECEAWVDAEEDLREEERERAERRAKAEREHRLEDKAALLCGDIIKFYRESGRPTTPNSVARVTAAVNLGALMQLGGTS